MVAMAASMAFTQTPQELNKVRKASCQVRVLAQFKEQIITVEVGDKKIELKKTPKWGVGGSGTIIGRSLTNDKSKPKWIYWIVTARHLFPENFKSAEKSAIWIYSYSYKGIEETVARGGSIFWVSPDEDIDVAFVGFYSDEELTIIPLVKNLQDNLFGVPYVAIGHPFTYTPFISEGRFTTNHPTTSVSQYSVGCSEPFAPGMSGGGIFIMKNGKLHLAAIITGWVGNRRYPTRFGYGTRIDSIISLLRQYKKMKFVEVQ